MLEKFYEIRIRENKQYIGITTPNGGLQGSVQVIGHSPAEPTSMVVDLITDILLFTKFKLAVSQGHDSLDQLEVKGIH